MKRYPGRIYKNLDIYKNKHIGRYPGRKNPLPAAQHENIIPEKTR